MAPHAPPAGPLEAATAPNPFPTPRKNERDDFLQAFDVFRDDILDLFRSYRLPAEGMAHVKRMFDYTLHGGKLNRGLTVASAYAQLTHQKQLQGDAALHCAVLGWAIEWLQSCFLIADDIMDQSITRRGQPCWYKLPGVGAAAINDAFLVEAAMFALLRKYFRRHARYSDFVDLFQTTIMQTELGQLMDLLTAPEDHVDLARFSAEKHAYIVEYKTAYYSFYLPVAAAMLLADITDEALFAKARGVLLPLGEYFQVQDDFLDCYGDPAVMGKVGTDIQDNKCSWLVVQALQRASPEQRARLDAHYGRKTEQDIAAVKQVYRELDIEQCFRDYEEASYRRILALIDEFKDPQLPPDIFIEFTHRIYKRKV
ncbi:hypothetical protein CXG81DRAFT_13470 [Caulochytrium protostelioides]|uniref:Farnesyl pyrophosphate synthase n=1 Tax=Caulochytrium protostelioides TaxID=1555241 RepID=A0A4V1IUE1_9FUNG|nr:hypothetical protein CXG81DRAFT_13470 [Caulochytrium protostelioides]|eukprot:RKP00239.1 hypothetical protein CXG81DRAFT_13470 [Caulochytrium protostelioides]